MATVILARHGRTTANADGILAGRSGGVHLDEHGRQQATKAAERLRDLPLARAVSSPMERCRETAALLVDGRGVEVSTEQRLTECDYGDWTGRSMKDLVKEDLWKVVQAHPAGVRFPGGEAMAEMSARAVSAVRDIDAAVEEEQGAEAIWLAVSHGDVIKAILADALGVHLDQFQRIVVDPASLSVVRYTATRPFVLGVNSSAGSLAHLVAGRAEKPEESIGGGAGSHAGAGTGH
jgi:2,3-bisphosphoglycerate-dependent phosphoglycerate mutase